MVKLKVKKSQLPDSGKGLFTLEDIKKGEKIVEYLGEIVPWKVCAERAKEDKGGYVLFINNNHCIDAFPTKDAIARYANDARGLSRVEGLKNNAQYEIEKKRGYIVSKRNIKAGEEILVGYGKEYWDVIKENLEKEEKLKVEKKSNTPKKKKTGKK